MTDCPTPTKIRYDDASRARYFAKNARGQVRAYECECGGWHITSMTKREQKLARKRGAA